MNSVVHFEVPAKDLNRAKQFYSKVFGWGTYDMDDKNTMVSTTETDQNGFPVKPGAINGSIYLPDKSKTPTFVIDVPNLEEHIKMVTENGGKLVDEPVTIENMGRYARFVDPEGNLVGLWETLPMK